MFAWFQTQRPQPRPFPRADERLARELQTARIGLDKQVFRGLIAQWAVVLLATLAWSANVDSARVGGAWSILLLNGVLTGVPLWLVLRSPGERSSRLAVAACQGWYSTLLFYATAGRVETHLHLFVWLAVLAVYRDVRVLIVAATAAVVSQLVLTVVGASPELIGSNISQLGEHAVWLIVETTCLATFVRVSVQAMSDLVRREAALESLNGTLEQKVEHRTRELSDKVDSLHREYAVIREVRDQIDADEPTAAKQLSQLRRDVSTHATTLMDTTWCWSEARLPEALRPHWQTIREASQNLLNLVQSSDAGDSFGNTMVGLHSGPAAERHSDSVVGLRTFNLDASAIGVRVETEVDPDRRSALLLIDDPVQQALTVRALSEEGFRVDIAHSGPRAYYSAMLRDYDLILIDVDLDNEEGFDTIEALQLLPQGIGDSASVFAISSVRSSDKVLRGTQLGIDGFLLKPLNQWTLQAALSGQSHTDPAREGHVEHEAVSAGS